MNINIVADKCTGCTACEFICPTNAISMQYSDDGFLYPQVEETKCVDCGKCVETCPSLKKKNKDDVRAAAYYCYSKNQQVVAKSSSGGAFTIMAEYVLASNGIVFGAYFDKNTKEVLYGSTEQVSLEELRRSKYVASNPNTVFEEVKNALQSGRVVLFCGLSCHVAGLKSFLKNKYDNLITCDLICGGVASARIFQEYLRDLEDKYKASVESVNFRPKTYGYAEHCINIHFSNGRIYSNIANCDLFFHGYFAKAFQRDCCYECRYRLSRAGDITIADYWGGLKQNLGSPNGISMIIANNEFGKNFIEKIKQSVDAVVQHMPLENTDYVYKDDIERWRTKKDLKNNFVCIYKNKGLLYAARQTYHKDAIKNKVKHRIKVLTGRYNRT